jgi:hypothetical protein
MFASCDLGVPTLPLRLSFWNGIRPYLRRQPERQSHQGRWTRRPYGCNGRHSGLPKSSCNVKLPVLYIRAVVLELTARVSLRLAHPVGHERPADGRASSRDNRHLIRRELQTAGVRHGDTETHAGAAERRGDGQPRIRRRPLRGCPESCRKRDGSLGS